MVQFETLDLEQIQYFFLGGAEIWQSFCVDIVVSELRRRF